MNGIVTVIAAFAVVILLGGCAEPPIEEQCAGVIEETQGNDDGKRDTKTMPEAERILLWNCSVFVIVNEIRGELEQSRQSENQFERAGKTLGSLIGLGIAMKVKEELGVPEEEKLHPEVAKHLESLLTTLDFKEGTLADNIVEKLSSEMP